MICKGIPSDQQAFFSMICKGIPSDQQTFFSMICKGIPNDQQTFFLWFVSKSLVISRHFFALLLSTHTIFVHHLFIIQTLLVPFFIGYFLFYNEDLDFLEIICMSKNKLSSQINSISMVSLEPSDQSPWCNFGSFAQAPRCHWLDMVFILLKNFEFEYLSSMKSTAT